LVNVFKKYFEIFVISIGFLNLDKDNFWPYRMYNGNINAHDICGLSNNADISVITTESGKIVLY